MTRSRGQFDTRHDDGERDATTDGRLGAFREWLMFHRVEFLLACWVGVGGVLTPVVFGVGRLAFEAGGSAPEATRSFFWTAILLGIPLLGGVLLVHAAVDGFRLTFTDAETGSLGHVALRILQTASALVFAWGVEVMVYETAGANVEFDPAALLSAFLLIAGVVGMLGTVALDGVVRFARGNW